jgi:zinc protease
MSNSHQHVVGGCLASGLQLRTVTMPSLPIVSLAFVFRAGSDSDPAGHSGVSHLTALSLDAGTTASDIHALAGRIEFFGTSLHVTAMHDATIILCSTLKRHLPDIMAVIGEILSTAAFPVHEVERLRTIQMTSLLQMRDRPGVRASLALDRILFGDQHPYGKPVVGMRQDVGGLTAEDAKEFFASRYRPDGALALATGDITFEEWRTLCEHHLGPWKGTAETSSSPAMTQERNGTSIYLIDRPATPQAEIRIGCIAMQRNHPEHLAAHVLNHCLGGQFTSRLNSSLREQRGLTYGAWSTFAAMRTSGSYVMGGAFATDRADEAIRVCLDEITNLVENGITNEELLYAQRSLTGSFLRAFETPAQVNSRLEALCVYDLPEEYYETYVARLLALTRDDIVHVARCWLIPERFAVVVVGDATALTPKLGQLRLGETIPYADA